jgi:hypothetical protein
VGERERVWAVGTEVGSPTPLAKVAGVGHCVSSTSQGAPESEHDNFALRDD